MKISPLVMFAGMRIPALTDHFSDVLALSSMTVETGGLVTLTCTADHGITDATTGVSIVDALTPNPITAWSLLGNGDVSVTVSYPHTMSTTPDASKWLAWTGFAIFSGTGVAGLMGSVQLVSVQDRLNFVVRPAGPVTLPGSVPVNAVLLERLEQDIIGWHEMTVASATTLTFATPASISRSYTVQSPKAVTNIRVWGAIDLDHALRHFTRESESNKVVLDQGYLFVCPPRQARLSRDRNSHSDAMTELQPGSFIRQLLMDGFEVYAVLPAERYGGAIGCVDKCQGPIFTAVLRTFNGLRLPFTELASPNPFISMLTSHGVARYDRANYVHGYSFAATVYLTEGDTVPPISIPDLLSIDAAIQNGDPVPIDTGLVPIGTVPLDQIFFNPGIYQKDHPQPLTATVNTAAP